MKVYYLSIAGLIVSLFSGCSSGDEPDPNDPNNPGGHSGVVTITGTSPEFAFWGDVLTITGTGFSEVKSENVVTFVDNSPNDPDLKLTSKDGDIEIVSASKTKLVIRVPYKTVNDIPRGEDFAKIEVAVKDAKATSETIKFIGLPRVGTFVYHYGGGAIANLARSGDSVVLGGGFFGSKNGAGEAHPKAAGVWDKLKLHVYNNTGISEDVPIKYRKINASGSIQGWGLYLPASSFSAINCQDSHRSMIFEFSVQGTDKKSSRALNVTYLPEYEVFEYIGPGTVYKSAGGVPFWTVTGEDMYYDRARFVPSSCNPDVVPTIEVGTGFSGFVSEFTVGIPVHSMEAGCTYGILLVTPCDVVKHIGYVATAE